MVEGEIFEEVLVGEVVDEIVEKIVSLEKVLVVVEVKVVE